MDTKKKTSKKHLQYAFLIDKEQNIIPCDAATEDFFRNPEVSGILNNHLSMNLRAVIVSSVVVVNNTSYIVKTTPISGEVDSLPCREFGLEYIVTFQNQSYFSYIVQALNSTMLHKEDFNTVFDIFANGIFITDEQQSILFISNEYEKLTGLSYDGVVGKKLSEMIAHDKLNPLITPNILKTNRDMTLLQRIDKIHYAIISGSPIYNSSGDTTLVVTCINAIDNITRLAKVGYVEISQPSNPVLNNNYIDLTVNSPAMRNVVQNVVKIAGYDVPVLLTGESGTGKEVIASIICSSSKRRTNPFMKINCSALSPSLLESELFGYEAGSFTGALTKGKIGLFEAAQGGTILLDEIGELNGDLQAKLLRVLQDGELYRIGSVTPIKVDVRIIAATNKNLLHMVEEGVFRKDLFYRLNVISIRLPALRERKEDIKPLLFLTLYRTNQKYGTSKILSTRLIDFLIDYPWPGNVRELINLMERLILLANDNILTTDHFFSHYKEEYTFLNMIDRNKAHISIDGLMPLKDAVNQIEKHLIAQALSLAGSTRGAAALLEVSQSTIMRKIKEHGINIT